MGDFVPFCGNAQRLGWQHMALAVTLVGLVGATPAWGQASTSSGVQPTPLLLAQASSQQFNRVLFVNPLIGDDQRGTGSLGSPFRSITRAVQFAEPETVIFLSAGSYTERSGEQFPIVLPAGVRLMEDPAAGQGSIAIAGAVNQGTTATTRQPATPATQAATATRPTTTRTTQATRRSPSTPTATLDADALPPVDVRATIANSTPTNARRSPAPAPHNAAPDASPSRPLPGAIPIPALPAGSQRSVAPVTEPRASMPRSFGRSPQAISIPVPPPESTYSAPQVQATEGSSRLAISSAPIEIPVPPPENPMPSVRPARPAAAPVANVAYITQPSAAPTGSYDLLPVPDSNIPLGYTGDLPRIPVANLSRPASVSRATGGTVSRGTGVLQYRVLVRAENEDMRDWVRSVVPDAFETVAEGQTLLQIGAFQNLENAEEAAEQLSRSGIRAIIEEWR
jgi:hypothetical protein